MSDDTQNAINAASPEKRPEISSAFNKKQLKVENAKREAERAKAYFTLDEFIDQMERCLAKQARKGYKSYCSVGFDYAVGFEYASWKADAKRDAPYLQQALKKFKEKYPELNLDHIRVSGKTEVVLDTKRNSFVRRRLMGMGNFFMNC